MEDRDEQLIRRALGRRPPPAPGPTLADGVMRRVAARPVVARDDARKWLAAASWLATGLACVATLAQVPWSGPSRAVAWVLALASVPLVYAAALWPGRFVALLALCVRAAVDAGGDGPRPRGGARDARHPRHRSA